MPAKVKTIDYSAFTKEVLIKIEPMELNFVQDGLDQFINDWRDYFKEKRIDNIFCNLPP